MWKRKTERSAHNGMKMKTRKRNEWTAKKKLNSTSHQLAPNSRASGWSEEKKNGKLFSCFISQLSSPLSLRLGSTCKRNNKYQISHIHGDGLSVLYHFQHSHCDVMKNFNILHVSTEECFEINIRWKFHSFFPSFPRWKIDILKFAVFCLLVSASTVVCGGVGKSDGVKLGGLMPTWYEIWDVFAKQRHTSWSRERELRVGQINFPKTIMKIEMRHRGNEKRKKWELFSFSIYVTSKQKHSRKRKVFLCQSQCATFSQGYIYAVWRGKNEGKQKVSSERSDTFTS